MAQLSRMADATATIEARADRHPLIRLAELYRLASDEDRARIELRLEQFLSLFGSDREFQQRLEQSFWEATRTNSNQL